MKRIREILEKKSKDIEDSAIKMKNAKDKKQQEEKSKLLKEHSVKMILRDKEVFTNILKHAKNFGFVGLIFGALAGFAKGCKSYGDHYIGTYNFLEPFRYIPYSAILFAVIFAVIGIIWAFNENRYK